MMRMNLPDESSSVSLPVTLRDYFAAKAMQAYLSSDEWRSDMYDKDTARSAYEMADEMLKAREA